MFQSYFRRHLIYISVPHLPLFTPLFQVLSLCVYSNPYYHFRIGTSLFIVAQTQISTIRSPTLRELSMVRFSKPQSHLQFQNYFISLSSFRVFPPFSFTFVLNALMICKSFFFVHFIIDTVGQKGNGFGPCKVCRQRRSS